MMSGVSGAAQESVTRLRREKRRVKQGSYLRADEYVPDALGVLYGLG